MYHKALNNYSLTLNGSIDDTVTTISVTGTPATLTPVLPVYMTVEDEIVEVTAVVVNDLTVVRGVEGTTAVAHANGALLNLYIVAGTVNEVIDGVIALEAAGNTLTNPVLDGVVSGTAFLDEDDMVSDSDVKLASQQSIKKYVDDSGLVLGETITTAYRGDRGKISYDHSQLVSGNPHSTTKSDVGLGNVDDTSDATKNTAPATLANKTLTSPTLTSPVLNGTISGDAFLDEDNMISDSATKLASQQSIKKYVDDNSSSLVLGETISTAYRGDRGKIAYDHSQLVSGNPHSVTKSDVDLGNVDNTSDATKNAAPATLDNKTLTSPTLTGSPVLNGSISGDAFLDEDTMASNSPNKLASQRSIKKYVDDNAGTLVLGETISTAYRGDRGKIAYDHSQLASGNPHSVTKSDVGLANADNTSDASKNTAVATLANKTLTSPILNNPILNGSISGDAFLDEDTMVSNSPSKLASQQSIKKYVDDNSSSLVLGETISTAYRGDRGKIAYDHSQLVSGNPHSVTKLDLGLDQVNNTSDATKNTAVATLANKTLTSPTINSPTINTPSGLVKGDVGLGNVDDTSDASKNTAAATLANKTLTSPILNGTISGDAFLDEDNMISDSATKLASQQSIKKYVDDNSGGGALYDAIVDAGGDGDYTSIKTAIDTEASDSTIYVRNGAYSESTFIVVKQGQKIIGESRDGVVLTSTSSSWSAFRFDFGAYRGGSERNSNNTAWTTGSIGTITVTNGSSDVVYNGTGTDPVATDLIHIEPNFYAICSSVVTGTKTITLDRPWGGVSASGLDCIVVATTLTDTEVRTEFSNMTVVTSGAGIGAFRNFTHCYNLHLTNIKTYQSGGGGAPFVFNLGTAIRSSLNDCEIDGNDQGDLRGFLLNNGVVDVHVRNMMAYNIPNAAVQLQGGTRAVRRSTLHFKSLTCALDALSSPAGVYKSLIQIDNVLADRIAPNVGGSSANYFESKIEVKRAVLASSTTTFEGAKSIFVFNYVNNGVKVLNITDTTNNIITDSYIDGTLEVDSEAVISGSVVYDALVGSPAKNTGYEF